MNVAQRFSRKRESILHALQASSAHPSAREVYEQLRREHPDISLATVYRNLSLFKQQGRAVCVAVVDGEERFDAITQPHAHFICGQCGAVIDLPLMQDDQLSEAVQREFGHAVAGHHLEFHGTCNTCVLLGAAPLE